jgi:hypothetical protein
LNVLANEDAMDKYLITFRSENKHTGGMMVTTSARSTCPDICPLRKNGCYAENGHLGRWIWTSLDKARPGDIVARGREVYNFSQLLIVIRLLAPGSIWRHNQAGDLPTIPGTNTIDTHKLRALVEANRDRRGFTYTHHDVLEHPENRDVIAYSNANGFTINLSANNLQHADKLAALNIAPVAVVLRPNQSTNTTTPIGRHVALCPTTHDNTANCNDCQICSKPHKAIIGFPKL